MSFNKNTNQVTVTYALVSSKDMVNIEWYLDYDGTALKVNRASNTDEDLNWTIMPKVDGALININEANVIKANYSSIGSLSKIKSTNGNPVDLITVTFDVLRPVDTEINLRFKNLVVGTIDPSTRMLDEESEELVVYRFAESDGADVVSSRSTVIYAGGYQGNYSPADNSGQYVYDSDLKFSSYSISLAENITMALNAKSENIPEGELGVLVEHAGSKSYIDTFTQNGSNHVFSFSKIYPQTMGENVKARLVCVREDGCIVYGPEYIRSVKGYAENQLSKDSFPAAGKTLLVNLLNYGAAAQKFTNYNTGNLANSTLTAQQKGYALTDMGTLKNVKNFHATTISNPTAEWTAASLVLGNSIQISATFTADSIKGKTIMVRNNENNYTETIGENDIEHVSGDKYRVVYKSLYSFQTSDTISFTVMQNGKAVSDTMTYSVSSYAKSMLSSQSTPAVISELLTAMMLYGKAAEAFR